jgi:hypothetical protein
LNQGARTADLVQAGKRPITTSEMGRQVVAKLRA